MKSQKWQRSPSGGASLGGCPLWWPHEVEVVPLAGPPTPHRGVDSTIYRRDHIRVWSDGQIDHLRGWEMIDIRGFKGPGDYCYYCGAWNGAEGEFRIGIDCCHCGGN